MLYSDGMRRGKSLLLSCFLAFKEAVLLKLGPKPKQHWALLITINVANDDSQGDRLFHKEGLAASRGSIPLDF